MKFKNITIYMSKFDISCRNKYIYKHILRTLAPIAAAPAVPPLTALFAALFITSLNVTGSLLDSDDDMFVMMMMMIITQRQYIH